MNIDIQAIKDRLTMREVFERYGFNVDRRGFVCCPFHNEKTPSTRVYDKDFHCFGCGENGDIISFVQKFFGVSFQDALKKLDADFVLGIYKEQSFEYLRCMYYKQQKLNAEKERKKWAKQKADNEYWEAFDEWKRLDENRRKYKPVQPCDELHPLFVESIKNMDYQRYVLNELEAKRL